MNEVDDDIENGHKDTDKHITVQGLLVPTEWDDTGNIIAVAIATYSEEEYLIDRNLRGGELFAFVRQNVKISGPVNVDDRGRKTITVKEYEIKEESPRP